MLLKVMQAPNAKIRKKTSMFQMKKNVLLIKKKQGNKRILCADKLWRMCPLLTVAIDSSFTTIIFDVN